MKNHTVVTLVFSGVEEFKLEGFNHQNVIFGLSIDPRKPSHPAGSKFHIEFDPSFGVDATFDCAAIKVVDATPMEDATALR